MKNHRLVCISLPPTTVDEHEATSHESYRTLQHHDEDDEDEGGEYECEIEYGDDQVIVFWRTGRDPDWLLDYCDGEL